jgi:hypothetical protein
MANFNWMCSYCNRNATITDSNYNVYKNYVDNNNKDGFLCIVMEFIVCPNEECREYTILMQIYPAGMTGGERYLHRDPLFTRRILPESNAKPFPDYIPEPIRADYKEACLIKDLSPKASATLSRRCLQGIIRDFWGISNKKNLFDEIEAIKEKTDTETWEAIHAVRKVGNIGAHMEKDINIIVDVEPQEAELLIELIETLLEDWYINRHERQQRLRAIKEVAEGKKPQETTVSESSEQNG